MLVVSFEGKLGVMVVELAPELAVMEVELADESNKLLVVVGVAVGEEEL